MKRENRFCPNCGSEKVEPDTRHTNVLGEMIFNPNKWQCKNCNYSGLMPEGKPETRDGEKFDFRQQKQSIIDTDAGIGYAKYFSLVILLLLLYILTVVLF